MKFDSLINNILVHNPMEQNINIRLIMVIESKYIKNFQSKRKIIYMYGIYIYIFNIYI